MLLGHFALPFVLLLSRDLKKRPHLLMQVARKHATGESAQRAILRGARESLMIDRVYRGHLADMLEALR